MITKQTKKFSIVTGIRNAIGYRKRRGGAGAVAAALAVCAILASLSISAVAFTPEQNITNDDAFFDQNEGPDHVDWEKPLTEEPAITYNGATPARLPC